jgi:hypothetical protein
VNRLAALQARYRDPDPPLRTERRLELALLTLLLVLALQLLWLALGFLREPRIDAIAPAADSLRVVDAGVGSGVSAQEREQLRARPLFWASRRPVDEPADEVLAEAGGTGEGVVAQAAPALTSLTLTGVYGAGKTGGAILRYKGERMRIAVGQELDGWELDSVAPGEVVFVSGDSRDVRRLPRAPIASATAEAAAQNEEREERARQMKALAAKLNRDTPAAANKKKESSLSLGGR